MEAPHAPADQVPYFMDTAAHQVSDSMDEAANELAYEVSHSLDKKANATTDQVSDSQTDFKAIFCMAHQVPHTSSDARARFVP